MGREHLYLDYKAVRIEKGVFCLDAVETDLISVSSHEL